MPTTEDTSFSGWRYCRTLALLLLLQASEVQLEVGVANVAAETLSHQELRKHGSRPSLEFKPDRPGVGATIFFVLCGLFGRRIRLYYTDFLRILSVK